MTIVERLAGLSDLGADGLRRLGEDARAEAERLARAGGDGLDALLSALHGASAGRLDLEPWALWAQGAGELLRGRPARAATPLERARKRFLAADDRHTAARVELALVDALASLGRHRRAVALGRAALAAFTAAGDRRRAASALLNLGGVEEARDRIRAALALWRRARTHLGGDDEQLAALLDANLAAAFQALGRFRRAERLYASAAARFDRLGAHASALVPRLGTAEVQATLGEVDHAMAAAREIAGRAVELGDDNLLFEARLLECRLEIDIGHHARAVELAEETLPRCRAVGRLEDAARLASLRAAATARGGGSDVDQAFSEARVALRRAGLLTAAAALEVERARAGLPVPRARLCRAAVSLDRAGLAVPADLGRLACAAALAAEGRPAAAERLCRRVLARRHASVWPRLEAHRLAADLTAADRPAAAVRHLRRAVTLAESVRGRLAAEPDRAAFAARTVAVYERLVEQLLCRGDARARQQAFDLVARVKSRSLLEALDRRRRQEWRSSPEVVRRWNALRQELAALLGALEGPGGEHARYATAAVADRARRVARRLEGLELELARRFPGLGVALGRLEAPPLASLLAPGEVVLEVFLAGADLILFRLDGGGLEVVVRRGARAKLEAGVEGARFQLSKATYGRRHLERPGQVLVDQARSHLRAVGDLVLGPLAAGPPPVRLFVAPHGPLHHLPLAALELDGVPVVERCAVASIPGSALLAHVLSRPRPRPRQLGVAGAATAGLSEIGAEVEALAASFPNARTVATADVAAVSALLAGCDAVHLAAHGAFQPLYPQGSGIKLADGWLTAVDLLQLPIRADLVFLGACASGQVEVARGEEVAGVVRALLASGVRTTLAAPGALDDALARDAATLFYGGLLAHGPGEALRRTLVELRREHPHPALWAGLQLYGDPRPWEDTP